jgi:hypothetical protein
MSKRLEAPTSRLICVGSARALTNAVGQVGSPEEISPYEYAL